MLERFNESPPRRRSPAPRRRRTRWATRWSAPSICCSASSPTPTGAAGRAFRKLGVTVEGARELVLAEVPPGQGTPGELPFSPRARGTLDGAPRQAMGLQGELRRHRARPARVADRARLRGPRTCSRCSAPRPTCCARPCSKSARRSRRAAPAGGLAPGLADAAREVAEARGAGAPDAGDLMLALADRSATC